MTEKNKEMPWTWRGSGKPVEECDIPMEAVGFIYCITNTKAVDGETGKFYNKIYIGKKQLTSTRRSKIGVREKAATNTRKRFKKTTKDSGWATYWSSCKELKEDVQKCGEQQFNREILEWCHSKKYMSYREMYHQVRLNVLENSTYNGNVLNRWFRKDVVKPNNI